MEILSTRVINNEYAEYEICTTLRTSTTRVWRRYKEFTDLRRKLGPNAPKLTGKTYFASGFEHDVVLKRRVRLQEFLSAISIQFPNSLEFWLFLGFPRSPPPLLPTSSVLREDSSKRLESEVQNIRFASDVEHLKSVVEEIKTRNVELNDELKRSQLNSQKCEFDFKKSNELREALTVALARERRSRVLAEEQVRAMQNAVLSSSTGSVTITEELSRAFENMETSRHSLEVSNDNDQSSIALSEILLEREKWIAEEIKLSASSTKAECELHDLNLAYNALNERFVESNAVKFALAQRIENLNLACKTNRETIASMERSNVLLQQERDEKQAEIEELQNKLREVIVS